MAWSITSWYPTWGDQGEQPPANLQYSGGDQVNEKHLDYLWYSVGKLEDEVRAALTDLDSDQDGKVDAAEDADTVAGQTPSDIAIDVEDDGTVVISDADAVNFGSNISVTDDGDNTVTVSSDDDATTLGGQSLANVVAYQGAFYQERTGSEGSTSYNPSGSLFVNGVDIDVEDGTTATVTINYTDGTSTSVSEDAPSGGTARRAISTPHRNDVPADSIDVSFSSPGNNVGTVRVSDITLSDT